MQKTQEPYSLAEKLRLLKAIEDKLRPYEIRALFPNRTERAIYTKIRYEKHKELNKSLRITHIGVRPDDEPPVSDADAVSSNLDNQEQDARFQDALRAAIDAGLEIFPVSSRNLPCGEFRPVHFDRQSGVSFGRSPALLCAELGSR
jgi:hypothetical protein